jgi:hypothetical protein
MRILEKFKEFCGSLGGYETDFMYVCSFLVAFAGPLKNPQWTFVGVRSSLEMQYHEPITRDVMRRCFVLAGRNIIGGMDDPLDGRMDRALARLMNDREFEYSLLLESTLGPLDGITETSFSYLALPADNRVRVLRFLMQVTLDNPNSALYQSESPPTSLVGVDEDESRYFFIMDTSLEVGCWKEVDVFGSLELIATNVEALTAILSGMRSKLSEELQSISGGTCGYCRKRSSGSSDEVVCTGCKKGSCHYRCVPALELQGFSWTCSKACAGMCLVTKLTSLVDEVEPLQRAAMRKRRRLAAEINSLQISTRDTQVSESTRTSKRGRVITSNSSVDYSFRDYDKAITDAIRKSERRSDNSLSDEETPHTREQLVYRPVSRDERMARRSRSVESEEAVLGHEFRADQDLVDQMGEPGHTENGTPETQPGNGIGAEEVSHDASGASDDRIPEYSNPGIH